MHPGVDQPVFALIGPPNCGKTTLFNQLTGASFHTANYPGATVEHSLGALSSHHGNGRVLDLPGMTSLSARSPDEEVAVGGLFGQRAHPPPDVVLAVADATQLSRHLYLTLQLKRAGFPVVLAVTMTDLLPRRGLKLDAAALAGRLAVPVITVDPRTGDGVPQLLEQARELAATARKDAAAPVRPALPMLDEVKSAYALTEALERASLVTEGGPDTAKHPDVDPLTSRIDGFLLHPLLGPIVAFLALAALFAGVFSLAQPMMDFIDGKMNGLADWVLAFAPDSTFVKLLGDGIIRGAGAVLVFVPQIAILFLGMGLLEDSGYLARVAMLVDRPLSALGLNGRSLVPLLSGFACAIPGMMAARTIPNRRERLLTLFVMPLTSCSARLPVYALLIGFVTPKDKPWIGGLVLAALYIGSMLIAAAVAGFTSRMMGREGRSTFLLELPTYHRPLLKPIVIAAARRTMHYVTKAGPAILILSILLWVATNYPSPPAETVAKATPEAVKIATLENSFAARAGKLLEPVMRPLDLDWRVGVALIGAFAAREVFVATLAIILHAGPVDDESTGALVDAMRSAKHADGRPLFTVPSTAGLLVFFLIALQCLATVAVCRKESGSWRLPIAQVVAFIGLAYLASASTVQALKAFWP
jgi:ferrous iron transport protein B